ncbi:MAG: fimbrillin family protein [Bacteroidaceae bacterium]
MKKNLFLGMATLAMIMAGCSQDEVLNSESSSQNDVIGFSTYTSKTKAAQAGTNTNLPGGFGVTAFVGAVTVPYMGSANAGVQISWKTDKWDYENPADLHYWPIEPLKFYAYAPFANTNRVVTPTYSSTDGMTFTNYEVSATNANQDDFMYASNLIATKGDAWGAAPVALVFNHALTQILFTAITEGPNLEVDIEKDGIKICNVVSKGTFVLPIAGTGQTWTPSATKTDRINYTATSDAQLNVKNVTTVAVNTTPLTLMPQTLVKWATAEGAEVTIAANDALPTPNTYLEITCKIRDTAGNYLLGSGTAYGKTYVPFAGTWAMGKKITYALTFGGGYDANGRPILKPITFIPTVEDWVDEAQTVPFK